MDETKHVIVFKTAYFEVVVSHGYFDLLTYATYHSDNLPKYSLNSTFPYLFVMQISLDWLEGFRQALATSTIL